MLYLRRPDGARDYARSALSYLSLAFASITILAWILMMLDGKVSARGIVAAVEALSQALGG